jgi:hypothetical protein
MTNISDDLKNLFPDLEKDINKYLTETPHGKCEPLGELSRLVVSQITPRTV